MGGLAMAADRSDVLGWLVQKADLIVTDQADRDDLETRFTAATSLTAAEFAAESIYIARVIGESVRSESSYRALLDLSIVADPRAVDAVTILSVIALSLSIGRVGWISRRAARRARSDLINMSAAAYDVTAGFGPDLHGWIENLSGLAIRLISDQSANMAPMVTVQAGVSLPSTVLAYRLYGNSGRASELAAIAGSGTPFLMPVEFEAMAL